MHKLKDKKALLTLVLSIVLTLLHTWQFFKSGYDNRALFNAIASAVYIPLVCIFGFQCLPIYLLVYSFSWLPFEEFDSYTSLFMLCSAISLDRKLKYSFIPFVIMTVGCYMFKEFEISHLMISICYLLFFFTIYIVILIKHNEEDVLDLTPEEEQILSDLCSGKEVKETDFSESTAYRKLRKARDRNDCITNGELKSKYKKSHKITTK